ncbi:MAG: Fe-S cluster assembly protein SufD [Candidatus Binatia bacterium]
MVHISEVINRYLRDFERFEKDRGLKRPGWVRSLRSAAIAHFAELGFPTTRNEEWKYTSLARLLGIPFSPAPVKTNGLTADSLVRVGLDRSDGSRLVFINGFHSPELSCVESLPGGVRVGSLSAVLSSTPSLTETHLAQYAGYEGQAMVALNTAFMEDGAFVYVPAGQIVEEPIYLLFIAAGARQPTVSYPRNLVVAGPASRATIIECFTALEADVYFTNAVTEIVVGEDAGVDYYKLERESKGAFHIGRLEAQLGRGSRFNSQSITLGGSLVRNDVNAVLDGEGSECTLNGLYLAKDAQHMDNHTRIDHRKPQCISRELYKGVLDGKGRGVFNGKVYVNKAAQHTDAKQTNKNLLLSEGASIDTKPQLEIYADDVKCTHGSTIGRLDEDALFYLRARGLSVAAARNLLTYAFAGELIGKISVEPMRALVDNLVRTGLRQEMQGGQRL